MSEMGDISDMEFLYGIGTLPGILDGAALVNGPDEVFHLTGKAIDSWRETKNNLSDARKDELKKLMRCTYFEGHNEEGQLAWLHRSMMEHLEEDGGFEA